MVEVILGTTERALATQYATNPVAYRVNPPSFVRNWYSNDYVSTVTNGATNWTAVLYTNVFTNVISARLDRAMMVSLDTSIKALVPWYVDTNTVYDGTTNIVMLTVTGLWASLSIGDGTNQFTRTPAIVETNNTTNAATYGEWPWRIYKQDLEERYKVLNALKVIKIPINYGTSPGYLQEKNLDLAGDYAGLVSAWLGQGWQDGYTPGEYVELYINRYDYIGAGIMWSMDRTRINLTNLYFALSTNLSPPIQASIYCQMALPVGDSPAQIRTYTNYYDPDRLTATAGTYSWVTNFPVGTNRLPTALIMDYNSFIPPESAFALDTQKGYSIALNSFVVYVTPTLNFCTNKYWN